MNAEEVYALLNKKIKKGGITDDQIKQIVEQYLEKNPVQVTTDNTLSVAGTPADALATGTSIDSLKGDLFNQEKRCIKYKNTNNLLPLSDLTDIARESGISVIVGTSEHELTPSYDNDGLGIVPLSSGKFLFFTLPIEKLFDGVFLFKVNIADKKICSLSLQAYTETGSYLGNIVALDSPEMIANINVNDVKTKFQNIKYVRFQIANSTRFNNDVIYVTQPYFGINDDLKGSYWINNLSNLEDDVVNINNKLNDVPIKTKNNIINYAASYENTSFYPSNVLYQNYYDDKLLEKKGAMLRTDTVICNQGNIQITDENVNSIGNNGIDYSYFYWCQVQQTQNTYDFSPILNFVQKSYNKKHRVVLRLFPCCGPYTNVGEDYTHDGMSGKIAFPRYIADVLTNDNDAQWLQSYKGYWDLDINIEYVYQEYKKLVEEFSVWFENAILENGTLVKDCVLFIQLGIIGSWGEGYSYNLKVTSTVEDLLRYTKVFVDNITDKILSVGSCLRIYDSEDALKWNELFIAEKELRNDAGYVGHFIDNFGSRNKKFFDDAKFTDDENSNFINIFSKYVERGDFFNGEFALFFNANNWGKNIGQWSYDLIKFLKVGFLRIPKLSVDNGSKKYTINNASPYVYNVINSIASCIGFRLVYSVFYINKVENNLTIDIEINNIGTNRLYFDLYNVCLRVIDGNSDGSVYTDIMLEVDLTQISPANGNEPLQYGFGNGEIVSKTISLPYTNNIVKLIAKDKLGFEPMYFSNYERDENGCYPVYKD